MTQHPSGAASTDFDEEAPGQPRLLVSGVRTVHEAARALAADGLSVPLIEDVQQIAEKVEAVDVIPGSAPERRRLQ